MKDPLRHLGPGTLIAAAFIGPGTVTACTVAGANYHVTLLWAMALSIVATIVLQEMAARLGLIHGKGLAETVKEQIKPPIVKAFALFVVLSAILVGNAAYEAGNISGGALGLETIFPWTNVTIAGSSRNLAPLGMGTTAFVLLFIGNYKTIERCLVVLVLLMSLSFIITALVTRPNWSEVAKGIFVLRVPEGSWLTIIALFGTTVVPYNLFLHASLVREKWKGANDLMAARRDTYVSIIGGGLVSMAIIICASGIDSSSTVKHAADLARGLEPLYGTYAKYFLSIGMFAAGITSAITAPLAAAYVAKGLFGWDSNLQSARFRTVWIIVLTIGVIISSCGYRPIEVIQFAQIANGFLLPIIASFLLWIVNRRAVLGDHINSPRQNIFGVLIVLATIALGIRGVLKALF
ncbi:MAG: Nramp family divalent metal transporter [Verrucomicrobiales bacterium]